MPKEKILPGKISYEKLFLLMDSRSIKKINLRNDYNIHPATIQKIVRGDTINTDTICILCNALKCQPGDIMEYIENES